MDSSLRQKALVGTLTTGRVGLSHFPKTQFSRARGTEKHQLLQEQVWASVDEEYVSGVVGLRAARSMDKMGGFAPVQNYLDKHHAGRIHAGLVAAEGSLWYFA